MEVLTIAVAKLTTARLLWALLVCVSSAVTVNCVAAQDWPYWGATKGGIRYSEAAAIDRSNVSELKVAWVYRTGEA